MWKEPAVFSQRKEQYEEDEVLLMDPLKDEMKLLVYNDDHNTFDWVIESFIKVCGHTSIQAEQLSYMIHFTGKAVVKTGTKAKLKPMKEALLERGLSAVLEG
ncbi:ATP-dependent Clp protease adaptor ClpS [Saprospira sp. CCB-QB6]|uniref:ATP-dependent Clp protease adaptor ClpS n=1 Tax=Saprospira sp. CCB-QB6 TaxID=3023936 RepID=UPI00234ADBDA|nr:ATP-dependent Clp protease adaptor ClpS [Saprospira sp. CCB-QB6]WCL82580.1 ATP-dependent Clp protease adaptor ClpS [Saprospira sp. CCB-QB6]